MINDMYSQIVFRQFKERYYGLDTVEELKLAKRDYRIVSSDFGAYQGTIKKFLELKEQEFKEKSLKGLIKPFKEVEPLNLNLKGLDGINNKINKLNDIKLKYEFKGLFNLLNDSQNLIYNRLDEREKIIKDLNKFKSLKFFKVSYLSRYDLKKGYKHLTFKNDAQLNHSKIYFIKSGLYVLKTLQRDNITLKVFYIGSRYKTLLNNKSTKKAFCPLKEDKFNLSSIDAYKTLNKKDSIKYYSYCNNSCLDKKNRQLLRDIRKSKKLSRESLIDSLESRKYEIVEDMETSSSLQVLYYELELEDIEKYLSDLKSHDENNNLEDETVLNDYL